MSDTKMEIITSMNYSNTDNILSDMRNIIEVAQHQAHQAVNTALVKRNLKCFMRFFLTFWTQ